MMHDGRHCNHNVMPWKMGHVMYRQLAKDDFHRDLIESYQLKCETKGTNRI